MNSEPGPFGILWSVPCCSLSPHRRINAIRLAKQKMTGLLLVYFFVAAIPIAIVLFVVNATDAEREGDSRRMRISTFLLHIVVVVLGLLLFAAALFADQWVFAVWTLSFFGLAFSALRFSTIDPEANDPRSRQWFVYGAWFSVVALVLVSSTILVATWQGNFKMVLQLLPPLTFSLHTLWRHRRVLRNLLAK